MLSFEAARREIELGKFAPVYLFFGEESYLREELTLHLQKSFIKEEPEFSREKIDGREFDLQSVLARGNEEGLFSRRRLLIVDSPAYLAPPRKAETVKDEKESENQLEQEKTGADLLEAYFERLGNNTPDTIIVFLSPGVDRRKRIYKIIDKRGVAAECAAIKGDDLVGWINRKAASLGKKIDRSAIDRLLMAGDQNLHYFSGELEKYATYLGDQEKVITGAVVDLLFAGDLEGNVFKLADALAASEHGRAQNLLELLLSRREKPLPIFFMLVRHYRLLLQTRYLVEEGMPLTEITSTLVVHPFVARKLREQALTLDPQALEDIYIDMQNTDYKIKTGLLDPVQALRLMISRIYYRQNKAC